MKNLVIAAALAAAMVSGVAVSAEAALVIFGGTGQTTSFGGSQAASQGAGGAAIFGASATEAHADSGNAGAANTAITPTGVTSSHVNTSFSNTNNASIAAGVAVAGSNQNSNAGGFSAAQGTFGSIGLGVYTLP